MPNAIQNSHSVHPLPSELKQSENNIFSNLANRLARLTQYILNNPGKAVALGLAGQVIGSSALGKFQNQSSVGNNNLTQAFMDKPYLTDSLAMIEQRVAPALNLTWLNQTNEAQMESIPAWLGTNDIQVGERSHRTKREDREAQVKNYLLTNDVCLRNVQQNYEYLYASAFVRMGINGGRDNCVFTWTPGNRVLGARWRFETTDSGRTFYLYNPAKGRYLSATYLLYDQDRRYIGLTTIGQNILGDKWRMELLTTQGQGSREGDLHIALWNDQYGGTLYASDDKRDDKRRYVFTWKAGEGLTKARWKIENCDRGRRRREVSDRLEDTTSSTEKENLGYLDKTATKFAFFQIGQPDRINKNFEAASTSDFDSRAENHVASSQLNRTTIS